MDSTNICRADPSQDVLALGFVEDVASALSRFGAIGRWRNSRRGPSRGTDNVGAVLSPAFSPDGRSVVFWAQRDSTLKRIAVSGVAATTVCPAAVSFGVSWGADGIVFAQNGKGILRVSANGGQPELLVTTAPVYLHYGSTAENRTPRCLELLRAAEVLTDDLLKQQS